MNPGCNIEEDLSKAIETLQEGGLILYPTDTIWGIGADATNPKAVARIYALKKRNDSKSMLALLDSFESLGNWVKSIPDSAAAKIREADTPLTVIYDSPVGFADNLLAEDGSIGIRITAEKYSRELCRRFGKPIVSTSANISGRPAPAIFSQIEDEIIDGVDYTAEYRRDDNCKNSPSGIIKISGNGQITIIR